MLGFDGLRERVHPATVSRAETYLRQGRVLEFTYRDAKTLIGLIQGGQRAPYRCMLRLDLEEPELYVSASHCSCYVGGDCKHAVALLLAAQAQRRKDDTSGTPAAATDRWLKTVQSALTPRAEDMTHARLTQLIYVVRPHSPRHLARSVCLDLWQAARRKDGTLGKLSPFADDARGLDPADEAVVASLRRHHGAAPTPWSVAGDLDHDMVLSGPALLGTLKAMITTTRCRFADAQGPVLTWGAPRQGGAAWDLQGDGAQRLGLRLSRAADHVILTDPAVYIDVATHTVGELAMGVAEGLLAHIEAAPTVAPEAVAAFCEAVPEALQAVLPLPTAYPIRDGDAAPTPLLQLTLSTRPAGGAPYVRGHLHFCYGTAHIAGDAADALVWERDGDTLVRYTRAQTVEKDARAALQTAGVLPLSRGAWRFDLGDAGDVQALYDINFRVLAPLRRAGWRIGGEESLQHAVVEITQAPEASVALSEGPGWFTLDMGIEVEGVRLPLIPLLLQALDRQAWGMDALEASKRQHVFVPLPDGRVLAIPADRLRGILRVLQELYGDYQRVGDTVSVPLHGAAVLYEMHGAGLLHWHGGQHLLELAQRLRSGAQLEQVTPPHGLRATLRDYQVQGLSWLQFLRAHDLGGVLADDMGLGKTVQTLAHILLEKQSGRLQTPALIVAPTSVLGNWLHEVQKFAPSLRVVTHYGTSRQMTDWSAADVVMTTYGVLLRDGKSLNAQPFHLVVLDEAQAIKNPITKLHSVARGLNAKHRIGLTGTPLQNNLQELWALFNFAMPGLLGDLSAFRRSFSKPIEMDADVERQAALLRRLRPFLLRRSKDEVTRELPKKTDVTQTLELSGKQRDLYEAVRAAVDQRVRREIESRGMARASIVILDALLKLRQVCCDPRLVKLEAARGVFQSAKLTHLFELLPQLLAEGRRILLFSQFTGMLEIIAQELQRRDIAYLQLTGRTRNRQAVVESFQAGETQLFLISLKAGGTGLNLPQADTVIHYDPWWNPAVEDQATDRAHRIGQNKPVFVYKLIVANSVEAKMVQMQQRKRALFDALVAGGKLSNMLTEDDLEDLFAPL